MYIIIVYMRAKPKNENNFTFEYVQAACKYSFIAYVSGKM